MTNELVVRCGTCGRIQTELSFGIMLGELTFYYCNSRCMIINMFGNLSRNPDYAMLDRSWIPVIDNLIKEIQKLEGFTSQ